MRGCPIVAVTWRDAWFAYDEPFDADCAGDYIVETVGWLLPADGDDPFLAVAAEVTPDGWRALTRIPMALMLSVVVLREPSG